MGNQILSKVVLNPPGLCLGVAKMVGPYLSTKETDWVDLKLATSRQLISNVLTAVSIFLERHYFSCETLPQY